MIAIMRDGMGVGLAATQLGVLRRALVFQAGPDCEPTGLVNPTIEEILRLGLQRGASDVHFKVGERVMMRINGRLHRLNLPPLAPADARNVYEALRPPHLDQPTESVREADFSLSVPGAVSGDESEIRPFDAEGPGEEVERRLIRFSALGSVKICTI